MQQDISEDGWLKAGKQTHKHIFRENKYKHKHMQKEHTIFFFRNERVLTS